MLPSSDTPDWQPLLDLAPDHVGDFMWMLAGLTRGRPSSRWMLQLVLPSGEQLVHYHQFLERARQDSNLWPIAPEAIALSS
jgi:hypothetical protein